MQFNSRTHMKVVTVDNRRLQPRIPFFETVRIKRPDKAEAALGNSVDLSTDGISVHCDMPLWPGQCCLMEFNLPIERQTRKIIVEGEAWHCGLGVDIRGYRIGLLFVEIDSEYSRLIKKYIQHASE